jgi:hypothetical protein
MRSRLLIVLAVLAAAPASAGIADSPLPVLVAGKPTHHVYSLPFFTRSSGGLVETIVACTSTDTVAIEVYVERFSSFGIPSNSCSTSSLNVDPGVQVTFGTASTVAISIDSNVGGSGAGGSARILATSKKLVCTAFMVDAFNDPPTSMVHLTIIKGTKQKASN